MTVSAENDVQGFVFARLLPKQIRPGPVPECPVLTSDRFQTVPCKQKESGPVQFKTVAVRCYLT